LGLDSSRVSHSARYTVLTASLFPQSRLSPIPYYIHLKHHEPFALAGIWDNWKNPDTKEIVKTCAIITTQANPLLEKIHNTKKRMPVIIPRDKERLWLQNNLERETIQSRVVPYNVSEMEVHTVPNLINKLGFNTKNSAVIEKQEYLDLPPID
jgi:putative SOS response-associated peptidase YedK